VKRIIRPAAILQQFQYLLEAATPAILLSADIASTSISS